MRTCEHCGHSTEAHSHGGVCFVVREVNPLKYCECEGFEPLKSAKPERSTACTECGHRLGVHGSEMGGIQRCWHRNRAGVVCHCMAYKFLETPELSKTKGTSTMTKTSTPEKYTLPNGREYLTRTLGGFDTDVEGIRELVKMGKHVLLLADPGVGKTALFQAAFPKAENEIGHSKMTAWDMLWRWRPNSDGTYVAEPAPLVRAVTRGVPLYLDEAMRLSEDAWTPLFSAMDGRGFIIGGNLDHTDLPIKKGFCVIAASNPLVRGAFLPDAIASRFHILTIETSEDILVRLKLDERLLVAWRNLSNVDGGETWRPSIRELLSAQEFIEAGNMAQAAYALTGWRVPARDRAMVAGVIAPLLGVRVGELGGVIK